MTRKFILPLLILVTGAGLFVGIITYDRSSTFLFSDGQAEWIRAPRPVELRAQGAHKLSDLFRVKFEADAVPSEAVLNIRALGSPSLWIDDRLILEPDPVLTEIKNALTIDIASMLAPGSHELRFRIERTNGYPLLLAFCKPLKLFTGANWETSQDGKYWTGAWRATKSPTPEISLMFQRADLALLSLWWIFLPAFLFLFAWTMLVSRSDSGHWIARFRPTASQVRWFVIILWGILAINNIREIPLHIGMDAQAHYDYISYVAEKGSIPLATEGWQMFMPPLFYMVCALIMDLLKNSVAAATLLPLLRGINLFCGLLQVELCYRALRYVFPEREDLQAIGTVLGGLLPMNIYISQVVGNEPMTALFSGVAVVMVLGLISKRSVPSNWSCFVLGVVIGLGVLTKPTPILLIPPILVGIGYLVFVNCQPALKSTLMLARRATALIGAVALVAGWYYLRNYILMGHWFLGGWNLPMTGVVWWQHPSYRTIQQVTCFGECFFYPIYSAVHSLGDSLYSTFWADGGLSGRIVGIPPWNYSFMLSAIWLSIAPSAAIIVGTFAALTAPAASIRKGTLFPALCVVVYVLAVFCLFMVAPMYCIAKATYTLGLIPCYAVLAAAGLDVFMRGNVSRSLALGIIGCWAIAAYLAFLVV